MIPNSITRAHLERAIRQLGRQHWPLRRKSTRHDLVFEGVRVPPKEAIREAAVIAGVSIGRFSGGPEANNFLRRRGFVVLGKDDELLATTPAREDGRRDFPEGGRIQRIHQARERNGRVPMEAKRRRLAETGDLACEACGFSFVRTYGERGSGFIEAHHNQPLADSPTRVRTRIEDIALVCPNCHRMLHRMRPWLSVSELKSLLDSERENRAR